MPVCSVLPRIALAKPSIRFSPATGDRLVFDHGFAVHKFASDETDQILILGPAKLCPWVEMGWTRLGLVSPDTRSRDARQEWHENCASASPVELNRSEHVPRFV